MTTSPVTPVPGLASQVTTGGTPVNAAPPGIAGGFITNPYLAADQGVASEPLFINPVTAAGLQANGTTFSLQPGQSWPLIPGQTTVTSVNAVTAGHKFSVVYWF